MQYTLTLDEMDEFEFEHLGKKYYAEWQSLYLKADSMRDGIGSYEFHGARGYDSYETVDPDTIEVDWDDSELKVYDINAGKSLELPEVDDKMITSLESAVIDYVFDKDFEWNEN